jgi:hypothetical protein
MLLNVVWAPDRTANRYTMMCSERKSHAFATQNIILLPDDQAPLLYPFETGNDPQEFRATTLTRSPTRISRLPDRSPDMELTPKIGVYFCYGTRSDVGRSVCVGYFD